MCAAALAALLAIPGCLGGEGSGPPARAGADCLAREDVAPAGAPAVVALLGDVPAGGRRPHGRVNRLLRISLPGGIVQAERGLGPRWSRTDAGRLDSLRIDMDSGPLLAVTPDGRTVLALVRYPASGRPAVWMIDARTLATRCVHPLERDVRYSSLLLGRSGTLYAIGVRRAGRGRWDSVLTMADAETGKRAGGRVLREADQSRRTFWGKDWWAYGAALAADERRLLVSYHGGDTSGADWFRLSPESGARRSGAWELRCAGRPPRWPCGPGATDVHPAHGEVIWAGNGFVAATGGHRLLRLDRDGRTTRTMRVTGEVGHLMDVALGRRSLYVSTCGERPGIVRVSLAGPGRRTVRSGAYCGRPLAVHEDRFLLLDASRVESSGYPSVRDEELRLLDLEHPGDGRPVPRSAGALDAVVVGSPH